MGGGLVVKKACLGLLAVLLSSLVLAVGCGGGGDGDGATTPETLPPADEVLPKVVQRVEEVESFHFRLEHENGLSPIPLNLKLRTAEGDIQVPDRMKAELEADAGGALLRVEVIGIGEEGWITNPFNRQWQALPKGTTISAIFDPAAGITAIANSLENVSVAGVEKVEGEDTYLLQGQVDSAALEAAAPIAEPGLTVTVKLWVQTEDYSILQVRLEGPFAPDEPANIVRILHLSKFDEPVSIEPPV
jgi:lipoprotein LprG